MHMLLTHLSLNEINPLKVYFFLTFYWLSLDESNTAVSTCLYTCTVSAELPSTGEGDSKNLWNIGNTGKVYIV